MDGLLRANVGRLLRASIGKLLRASISKLLRASISKLLRARMWGVGSIAIFRHSARHLILACCRLTGGAIALDVDLLVVVAP